jgi:hypothetical protein
MIGVVGGWVLSHNELCEVHAVMFLNGKGTGVVGFSIIPEHISYHMTRDLPLSTLGE